MHTYPLRALSIKGDEVVEFSLADVPVKISNFQFVLRERARTPILDTKTITRGSDVKGLFEGDIIDSNGKLHVISYRRGFVGVALDKSWKYLRDLGEFEVVGNFYFRPEFNKVNPDRRIMFKSGDLVFSPWQIVAVSGDILLLNISKGTKVRLSETQQYAEFKYAGKKVYFGDPIKGDQLTLNNGACGVYHLGKWVDFADIEELVD